MIFFKLITRCWFQCCSWKETKEERDYIIVVQCLSGGKYVTFRCIRISNVALNCIGVQLLAGLFFLVVGFHSAFIQDMHPQAQRNVAVGNSKGLSSWVKGWFRKREVAPIPKHIV